MRVATTLSTKSPDTPMNFRIHAALLCLLTLVSCDKGTESAAKPAAPIEDDLVKKDTPILPIKPGDYWKYEVKLEIPPEVQLEGAPEAGAVREKIRTYLGKLSPKAGLPEVDAFDVQVPGQALEREFVEIFDDRIMMRGNQYPDTPNADLVWLKVPIPFAVAGMRPGMESRQEGLYDETTTRNVKVVAREIVEVPAGSFECLRLLMVGSDGEFQIRRTTWFAPGIGIVKVEKMRYAGKKLLFRETTSLRETNLRR